MASQLTEIFKTIGENDAKQESLGAQILAFLVKNKCATLDKANEQFGIAYDENGWSRTAGRPKEGSKEIPAPPTVKNYVTAFRRAYKLNLHVPSFKTVGEMRQAIKDLRAAEKEANEKPESLAGVQISKDDILTGFLVHDISVVVKHLPDEKRGEFETKLQRLLSQYMKKASPELKLVA
jgi:hypothetical protein